MARLAAEGADECTLATLGSFELRIRGKSIASPSTQKARALLSYLVLHRRTDVPRERLLEVFWPEAEPERARDSLNTALHSIRRGLRTAQLDPNDFLSANKSIIRWEAGVDLDVERIERALQTEDKGAADEALAQYHGEFLEGDYDEWTVAERERIADRYERLLAKSLKSTKAPDVAKKLLARNPYDEEAYATLIEAELGAGRNFSAAQILRQCRATLTEIGVKPSTHFTERFQKLDRPPVQAHASPEVPFVGRDVEFAELAQLLEANAAANIAMVEGEPGIGKTALIERFTKHADSLGMRVISLRAIFEDARAFAIWPSLYGTLTGEAFADFLTRSPANAAADLAEAVVANLPERSLLAIDDVQYLSGDALSTLIAIAKSFASTGEHVLVAGTRPEALNRISDLLGEARHLTLHLAPLLDEDVDTAMALAGIVLDRSTTETLRRRAGGHPLYLKGMLEQLTRSGALRHEGKRWELSQPPADLQLPPSLRRLVEVRIRGRGPEAVLVACALSLEPSAAPKELSAATALSEIQVLDAIDDLLRYHILVEPQTGPRQFAFAHDLLEEAARVLLPPTRRTRMHAELARVLSESNVRGRAVRRAVHLEASGSFAEAAAAYLEAAQESAGLQAPQATLERADSGLRCLAQIVPAPERSGLASRLHQNRSFALRLLWQRELCVEAAQLGVDEARAAGDLRGLDDALVILRSAINISTLDPERTLSVIRERASIGEQLGDNALVVQSLIDEGHAYRITFRREKAEPLLERAFEIAKRTGSPELITKASIQLLSLQAVWWTFEDAPQVLRATRESVRRVDWPYRTHVALVLAMLWTELERYSEAQKELDSVAPLLRGELPSGSGAALNAPRAEIAIRFDYFQAALAARRGQWDAELARFGEFRPMYEQLMQEQRYERLFEASRADLLLGRNRDSDLSAAAALVPAADDWQPETGYEPYHAALILRARVHARRGLPDARQHIEKAMDFLDQEAQRCPFGVDAGYQRLADAAQQAGLADILERARAEQARYRDRKLAHTAILVSV